MQYITLLHVTDRTVTIGKLSALQQKISPVSSDNPIESMFSVIAGEKSDVERRSDQFLSFYGGGTGGMRPWGYRL